MTPPASARVRTARLDGRTETRHARTLAPVVVALTAFACAGAAEQPVVERFFAAARLNDKTALASVATVSVDPIAQGSVTEFSILHIDREAASETVTVDATMHLPDGSFGRRNIVLTLRRAPDGRLTVTGVTIR